MKQVSRISGINDIRKILVGLIILPSLAFGTTDSTDPVNNPWVQHIESTPYQATFEQINPSLFSLALNFKDIVVPGNGGLDIVVERSYSDKDPYYTDSDAGYYNGGATLMGDFWDIGIPTLVALAGTGPWVLPSYTAKNGCQNVAAPGGYQQPPDLGVYSAPGEGKSVKTLHRSASTETQFSEISADNWKAQCITSSTDGTQGRVVYAPDGRRYVFNYRPNGASSWFLSKVSDRNGNWLQYNYGTYPAASWPLAPPLLNSITSNDGRTVTFNYTTIAGRLYLTSVVGPGTRVDYGYETYTPTDTVPQSTGTRLKTVTLADGTAWSFGYQSSVFGDVLSSVNTPSGGVFSYTYGIFGGIGAPLATKQVSGTLPAATWTFSGYENAYPSGITQITGPGFCAKNYFSLGTPTPGAYVNYSSVIGGATYSGRDTLLNSLWDYQTATKSEIYNDSSCSSLVRQEILTWDKRQIAPGPNVKSCTSTSAVTPISGGYYSTSTCDWGDANIYAPIEISRTVNQDGQAYVTSYSSFDSYGNPQTIVESGPNGGNRTTTNTFYNNPTTWVIGKLATSAFTGSQLSNSYDSVGNLLSETRDGVTTSYTYDTQGNVATETRPRGLVYAYSNYYRGIAQTESQPEAVTITKIVSGAGNVTSETNGDGYTTLRTYDGLNRVLSETYPTGTAKTISYTASAKTATRGGLVETTQFDGLDRTTSITLGGITTTHSYDQRGEVSFTSDPNSSSGTSFQHDALGRLTLTTNADGSTRAVSYGPATRTVTDERGNATTYSYRGYGTPDSLWLMSVAAPDPSANVGLARNTLDLITSAVQGGITRSYGYSSNYYLSNVTDPEIGTTTYGRDAAGNMISRSAGTSGTTTYVYDGQNRLTSVTYPGNASAVTNTYNKRSKLLTASSSVATRSNGYDANGNLTSESLAVDGLTLTTSYAYNGLDQLSSLIYPQSGNVVSYSPDILGRPTVVSGYVSAVAYWPSGMIKQINYANGTTTSYGQNSRLWPSSFATQLGSTAYINSSYAYDGKGNLSAISDSSDNAYNRSISYDKLDRLTGISGPWGSGTISYDGIGNIASQLLGGAGLYYAYDSVNRLASISGSRASNFTYDAYGNITSAYGNSYNYDGVPNLVCVNCAASAVQYSYDGTNRRVSNLKGGAKHYEFVNSQGAQLIDFVPSQGNLLTEYIYLGSKRIAQRVSP
jgi:YD repeat-containing protein